MGRVTDHAHDQDHVRRPAPRSPARAVQPGSLAWASAVGNRAVQRTARGGIAREAVPAESEEARPESEQTIEEGLPRDEEPADMAPAGLSDEEAAGLATLDDLPEGQLTE
jgi:hypothetical protein